VCESVTTIPGNSTTNSEERDEVWVIIKRTINGATKRYVEFLEKEYEHDGTQQEAHYVDSGLVYSGASTTTLTGLSHLEGETVQVYGNGAVFPDATVSSGQITVSTAVTYAVVGLKYTSKLRSLKWFDGGRSGSAVGRTKRIYNVTLIILDGIVYKIGKDASNLKEFDFREVSDPMDAAVPIFTGETERNIETDMTSDPRMELHIDAPVPFTLLAWAPKLELRENV
jgi:NAD-specific glutamate dehydrogenase